MSSVASQRAHFNSGPYLEVGQPKGTFGARWLQSVLRRKQLTSA